jgi:8-oxo-dGTP diphosphatase
MPQPGIDFPGVGSGLVIMRDGKVLLCKRIKAPEAGHWSIPGGKVDHLEPSETAARREAEEETGLTIGSVQFLCVSEQIIQADRQHWLSLIFVTEDITGEATLTEPDKLSDIGWFALDALPAPLSVFAQDAFRHIEPLEQKR